MNLLITHFVTLRATFQAVGCDRFRFSLQLLNVHNLYLSPAFFMWCGRLTALWRFINFQICIIIIIIIIKRFTLCFSPAINTTILIWYRLSFISCAVWADSRADYAQAASARGLWRLSFVNSPAYDSMGQTATAYRCQLPSRRC